MCVYEMKYSDGKLELNESHTMEFKNCLEKKSVDFSCFGRRIIKNPEFSSFLADRSIMAFDYEDELDLFGILGVCPGDICHTGFVKLYDSFSGKEVKTIELVQKLCETNYYQLHIDRDILIIIEKDPKNVFFVYVYNICEWK